MSYALLPRDDAVDPELGAPELHKTRGPLPLTPPFSNARLLVRTPRLKVILASITLTLLGLSVYRFAPARKWNVYSIQLSEGDDSSEWSISYRVRPKLPFIQEDGEPAPLKVGSSPARWPQDYPEAAAYLHENSIIHDVTDPWPEKPWIAGIWLAPERFPPGLQGQPYDSTRLPEVGKEGSQKPVSLFGLPISWHKADSDSPANLPSSRLVFTIHPCQTILFLREAIVLSKASLAKILSHRGVGIRLLACRSLRKRNPCKRQRSCSMRIARH